MKLLRGKRSRAFARLLLVLLVAVLITPARAQDEDESDWEIMVAGGAGLVPTYEGSDNYALVPVPFVYVNWKDIVVLGPRGLSVNLLSGEGYKVGAGMTVNSGRDENGKFLVGGGDSEVLRGTGDIGMAPGARIFASYDFQEFTFKGNLTRYLGDENDGALLDFSLSRTFTLEKALRITPSLSLTLADNAYMETFFGISAGQAALSRYDPYDARAGLKQVTFNLTVFQMISPKWFIYMGGKLEQLLGDAADSPISRADSGGSLVLSLGYRF